MNADPPAESPACVPPLSGVCPICHVGPGDLPSQRFFEALKHKTPAIDGAPPADDLAGAPQAAARRSDDSCR